MKSGFSIIKLQKFGGNIMKKCFKCAQGTDPASVQAVAGDIIYINQNPHVFVRNKDGGNISLDKVYVKLEKQERPEGSPNKCLKIPYKIELEQVKSIPGDIIYRSGDDYVYLHEEDEKGEKKYTPIQKEHYYN